MNINELVHAFLGLQDSFSDSMKQISSLHDWAIVILLAVVSVVGYLICVIWCSNVAFNKFCESESLEVVWTIVPMVVLFSLSLTSLRTLYMLEEVQSPDITIKVTGHQWYWSYESESFGVGLEYDSYLVLSTEQVSSGIRLLEVDRPLVLPIGLEVRLLVLSEDVVHSWAVPSLGVNVDGIPGRLNQSVVHITRAGLLYGQCSEICGAYHSFIPINVECFSNYTR